MIKKIGIYLLILSAILSAKDIYTVDELIIQALKKSPDIEISSSEAEASKKREDLAFSNYLPKVDLQLSGGEVGVSNLKDNLEDTSLIMGKLTARQIIYDFGKTSGNYDFNKYDSEAYIHSLKQKISDKKREVKSAYYKVLQSIALIKVNEESEELNEAQLYRVKRYYGGCKSQTDKSTT